MGLRVEKSIRWKVGMKMIGCVGGGSRLMKIWGVF